MISFKINIIYIGLTFNCNENYENFLYNSIYIIEFYNKFVCFLLIINVNFPSLKKIFIQICL